MLELPFCPKYSERLFERIESFIAETDCIPLIAHVDRYPAVWKKPNIVGRLIDMGCVIQLNADAFAVKEIKGFAKVVLERGMAHAIGSDMHNMDKRAPSLCKYTEAIPAFGLEAQGARVMETAADILADRIVKTENKPIRKFFGKYF